MRRRLLVVATAAAVALTAASLTAVTYAHGSPGPSGWSGPAMMRGPGGGSTCQVPASLRGQQVTVMLGDMTGPMMGGGWPGGPMMGGWSGGPTGSAGAMMLHAVPQTVSAGTVTLVVVNHGTRTHELVVLPLTTGQAVGTRAVGADNTVDETGGLGEASKACGAGTGNGITAGSTGWVTLTLAPGRYELVCNLPGHYTAGMHTQLNVT